jgi:hypothetical protein
VGGGIELREGWAVDKKLKVNPARTPVARRSMPAQSESVDSAAPNDVTAAVQV